jgi:Uncharacterized protein conserved in bacteria|tara:strand:+ start:89 stop:430 length:342 start_codon:yes stop_codon:yes gene_type:complete
MIKEIVLKVQINDKTYPISCKEGEEERVKKSANLVSDTLKSLTENNTGASDNRLLVMTSLILADKLEEIEQFRNGKSLENKNADFNNENDEVFEWIKKVTNRLNKVATLLKDS